MSGGARSKLADRRGKAAGKGRQQASALPPLTKEVSAIKERSFLREGSFAKGRKGRSSGTKEAREENFQGTMDEIQENHWNLSPPRRINIAVDKKIVTHLRKKLNRRLERRLNQMIEAELDLRDVDDGTVVTDFKRHLKSTSPDSSIFTKYTDYGEKISNRGSLSGTLSPKRGPLTPMVEKTQKVHASRTRRRSSRLEQLLKQQGAILANSAEASSISDTVSDPGSRATQIDKLDHKFDVINGDLTNKSPLPNIGTIHEEATPSIKENSSESAEGSIRKGSPNVLIVATHPSVAESDMMQLVNTKTLPESRNDGSVNAEVLPSDSEPCVDGRTKIRSGSITRRVSLSDTVEILDSENCKNESHALGNRTDSETEQELQRVMELNEDETRTTPKTFQDLSISPVPTPVVFRPETRDQSRMTVEDKVKKIIDGHINVRCPPDQKIIKVFISSAITDSEAERTALIERVFPRLKHYCLEKGYEIQLVDLHWGLRDMFTDDHTGIDFIVKTVSNCKENKRGLNFVVFMGQKYGDPILPTIIPVDEFEAMLAAAKRDLDHQLELAAAQRAAQEEAQRQREIARQHARSQESDAGKSDINDGTRATSSQASLVVPQHDKKEQGEGTESVADETRQVTTAKTGRSAHDQEIPEYVDPHLLEKWYKLDENAVLPCYRLQRISSQFKDVLQRDANKRSQARNSWGITTRKLHKVLSHYAKEVITDLPARKKYCLSVVEVELTHGLIDAEDNVNETCFWFKREIENVYAYLGDQKARDYLDLIPMNPQQDQELLEALQQLQEFTIPDRLSVNNVRKYAVEWHKDGISPATFRPHMTYVEAVCRDFYDVITKRIDQSFAQQVQPQDEFDRLCVEILEHVHFCHRRARNFHGRKEVLNAVKRYVRSDCRQPLVIHGKSGCGKTALMAKAAKDIHKWLRGTNCAVVVRMIGLTGTSVNIRLLLRGLCLQLCQIFGNDSEEVPTDFKGLLNDFAYRITQAASQRPLVIFLDALQGLSDENEARKLAWVPKELSRNVHIIVSTLPEEKYQCFKFLKKAFPDNPECFIQLGDIPLNDAKIIIENWFNKANRSLTDLQYDTVIRGIKACPLPLFLRLVFHETVHWPSYLPDEQVKVADTMHKAVTVLFGRLEKDYGEALVRRTLGYITASRHGVTNNELEDLLSLDEAVMDEICATNQLRVRRLPSFFWLRLREDLGDYLDETITGNCKTLSWVHSQFSETAEERYLNQRDKAPSYHKALAEYFGDQWFNKPKPLSGHDHGVKRFVLQQPLYREVVNKQTDKSERIYNLRRLNEQPYHLIHSQQLDQFKTRCLCNFEFLLAKLSATSLRDVFEDLQMALMVEPTDLDLKLLSDVLHLSSSALTLDPRQLASQIVGRLHTIIKKDVPVAPSDPLVYPAMHPLFSQAQKGSIPALIPSTTCLTAPGGILFDLLSGHTEPITAVTTTTDGQRAVTSSRDNTIKVWELRTGRVTRTIPKVGRHVVSIKLGMSNALAITSELSCIRIWSLHSGECLKVMGEQDDPAIITTAGEGSILVAFFDGSDIMRAWHLQNEYELLCEVKIDDEEGVHKDKSILVSNNSFGIQILHAFRSSKIAIARNAKTGNVVNELKCHERSASITALGATREYFIVVIRHQYMKLHEMCSIELFDAGNGKYVRSVRGCVADRVEEIHINQLGSHCLGVCSSEANNTSNIATWNIETEDHKHLAKHAKVSQFGACVDLRYVLTATKSENFLRIWNLTNKINQPAPKEKKLEGIGEIVPMVDNNRYVIAKAMNNGPISVWNVAKGKCSGTAVRIEHGLLDSSDVLIVRDTKITILTEKGFSTVTEDSRPVYQTVCVYDLKTKKYERKINGCYITPSPAHEYVLLDDDHLMGLSDNRSHFVVWNLVTGHVDYRIKSTFKSFERKRTEYGAKDKEDYLNEKVLQKRNATAEMTPWQRRSETKTARARRHKSEIEEERRRLDGLQKEKDNSIEQYMISKDLQTIVASYYAHHLCVFDVPSRSHVATFENPNSMMFLYTAALTANGSHFVHANYDEENKTSYVTLWDCKTNHQILRRLRNERNVCAIAMSDNADKVVFGKTSNELRIWDPTVSNSLRKIKGYPGLKFGVGSKIFMADQGTKAVVYAGDISVWNLENAEVLAVFTPDMKIQCFNIAMDGRLILLGLRESMDIVTLKLVSKDTQSIDRKGIDLFGETTEDSSDSEEEPEETKEEN